MAFTAHQTRAGQPFWFPLTLVPHLTCQGRTQGGHGGLAPPPQWLHDSPQLTSGSGVTVPVLKSRFSFFLVFLSKIDIFVFFRFCARRDSIERNSYGNVAGCLDGWVSVTLRYCIKTAKPIRKPFRPSESPIILVF